MFHCNTLVVRSGREVWRTLGRWLPELRSRPFELSLIALSQTTSRGRFQLCPKLRVNRFTVCSVISNFEIPGLALADANSIGCEAARGDVLDRTRAACCRLQD